jgi:hypothetical protein
VKIGLRTALAHSCRFNERGLLHWPTDDWPNDPDHRDDMFIHKLADGSYKPCTLFGDMSPEALTVEGLRAFGESFKAKIMGELSADQKTAFAKGIELCKRTAASAITGAELRLAPYANVDGSEDLPAWPTAPVIAAAAATTVTVGALPKGFLSYRGLEKYVAGGGTAPNADQTIAKEFIAQVKVLHDAFKMLFPRSRVMDPSAASSWIYKATSYDTFFENCIFNSGAPIWIRATRVLARAATYGTAVRALAAMPTENEWSSVIDATQLSVGQKTALKKAAKVLADTTTAAAPNAEDTIAAIKELVLGALSSPLQELNSGNNETASKFARTLNGIVGELDYTQTYGVHARLVYNMYLYRQDPTSTSLQPDDEKHFNIMYAMHRLLSKVAGETMDPVIKTLHVVAAVFYNCTAPAMAAAAAAAATRAAPAPVTLLQKIITTPVGTQDIIALVDGVYDAVVTITATTALVTVTPAATGIQRGPYFVAQNGFTYYRTRFTSLVEIDADDGMVAVHPAKPEFTAPVLHGANALNGTHPGGPAAMFGVFPPHHGGGGRGGHGGGHGGGHDGGHGGGFGGGHDGGHGGGFGGHHQQHEGRHPPPFASKHHEHYHDEEEHGHDERPAQRRRGAFMAPVGAPGGGDATTFGAPAYIRQVCQVTPAVACPVS